METERRRGQKIFFAADVNSKFVALGVSVHVSDYLKLIRRPIAVGNYQVEAVF